MNVNMNMTEQKILMQAIEMLAYIREACQTAPTVTDDADSVERAEATREDILLQTDAFLTTPDVQAFVTRQGAGQP